MLTGMHADCEWHRISLPQGLAQRHHDWNEAKIVCDLDTAGITSIGKLSGMACQRFFDNHKPDVARAPCQAQVAHVAAGLVGQHKNSFRV